MLILKGEGEKKRVCAAGHVCWAPDPARRSAETCDAETQPIGGVSAHQRGFPLRSLVVFGFGLRGC